MVYLNTGLLIILLLLTGYNMRDDTGSDCVPCPKCVIEPVKAKPEGPELTDDQKKLKDWSNRYME